MADCPCPPTPKKILPPLNPPTIQPPINPPVKPMTVNPPVQPRSPVSCPPVNIRLLTCDDEVSLCSGQAGAVVTRVNSSVTVVTIAPANTLRKTIILWNDSNAVVAIKFGAGASTSSFTWKIGPQSGYELPMPVYVGIITAVWEAANGAMLITEES